MQVGEQIGPYEIRGIIGRGGMAEVYKAWHNDLHCFHAIKVPLFQMGDGSDPDLLLRFLREARISANLRHPNIGTIHGVSSADEAQPYFAMEYIEGEDLSSLLKRRGKMPLAEAMPIIRQIADALDYAHNKTYIDDKGVQRKGIVHRDIKPSNILLEDDGKRGWKVKIVDFGIARAQEDSAGTRLTKAGMIVGTPEYMSPEQANTPDLVNKRSDLYSFGIIVYEMLCGNPPFRSEQNTSPISVLIKHSQEEPIAPSKVTPELLPKANKAVLQSLAKNPLDRFASCAEFVEALEPIGDPPEKRNWLPMGIGGVVLVGLVLIVRGIIGPPVPPLPKCDTATQCINIAACATSSFCQEVKRENESKEDTKQAKTIIDDTSAKQMKLHSHGSISPNIAGQLRAQYLKALALAKEAIRLNSQNDVAVLQRCRAEYYSAKSRGDLSSVLKEIRSAKKQFPNNTDFKQLEQYVLANS